MEGECEPALKGLPEVESKDLREEQWYFQEEERVETKGSQGDAEQDKGTGSNTPLSLRTDLDPLTTPTVHVHGRWNKTSIGE